MERARKLFFLGTSTRAPSNYFLCRVARKPQIASMLMTKGGSTMKLNQILTFTAIARHLNLSRTSAALRVSQSSVTQQMKKLEEEYQMKLYKKHSRWIALTVENQ